MHILLPFIGITLGSFIFSFGLNYFIIANGLAEGGFTGLALIIHYLSDFSVGAILLALNIPLLLLAGFKWGRSFIIKTLWSVLAVSISVDLTAKYGLPTNDLLLAALYGGVFSGLGIGIVFRNGATTGGLDIIARFIHERYGITFGKVFLLFDLGVITLVAILFGLEKALYSLVALYVSSYVLDLVIEGLRDSKGVIIISTCTAALTQKITTELQRGATIVTGYGAYTGIEKNILYVVVGKRQLLRLKKIIQDLDPEAFVIVNNVHEVMGEGFKKPF